ncbi:hypothetical protein QFZ62_000587 [Clavibacter sp. B3I6]|jgi:hypothetical protein|uniref:hypothetical protein n=1 Tax=Clavibacter sp. B3I6 TaxID=3042268 RepID=UPI00278AE036|nr:hypothetical protein [Clavibacter sp. B3I6]MDQ0743279.1 hypothetical protein [Clavibacter sp. B3I6]
MDHEDAPRDDDASGTPDEPEPRQLTVEEVDELDRERADEDSTESILADADRRDERADIRDAVSDERERVADKEAFTAPGGSYAGQGERRAAAQDRLHAKGDRESSADDRVRLTRDRSADGAPVDDPA